MRIAVRFARPVLLIRSLCGLVVLAGMAILAAAPAQAGLIVGGSSLVDSSYLAQLEAWLGQGELTLTNVFTKTHGSTSADFHAAVYGEGPTFSVFRATDDGVTAIVGGYNPRSWLGVGLVLTPALADRTAFLFNLTDGTVFRQRGGAAGFYQTYDDPNLGPVFGVGRDLYVDGALSQGYSALWSYGPEEMVSHSLVSGLYYDGIDFTVAELEAFTISAFTPVAVPEPGTAMMLMTGLVGAAAARLRPRRGMKPRGAS